MIKQNMKYLCALPYLALILTGWTTSIFSSNGITYSFTHGRFGDHVYAYLEARWLAYLHKIDFYYKPFSYSEDLVMHHAHKNYKDHTKKEVKISDTKQLLSQLENSDTLFVTIPWPANNPIGWDDQAFIDIIRNEVRPIKPFAKIEKPQGSVSVALHVRRGGGFDMPLIQEDTITTTDGYHPKEWENPEALYEDQLYPQRFPPDAYYIESLKYIAKYKFPGQPLYVYVFTDDPSPAVIAAKYQQALRDYPNITFDYRKSENKHNKNVLEDFFGMMEFDCLIRAGSHFSNIAGRIGRPKLELRPSEHKWVGKKLVITEIGIIERENGAKLKTNLQLDAI